MRTMWRFWLDFKSAGLECISRTHISLRSVDPTRCTVARRGGWESPKALRRSCSLVQWSALCVQEDFPSLTRRWRRNSNSSDTGTIPTNYSDTSLCVTGMPYRVLFQRELSPFSPPHPPRRSRRSQRFRVNRRDVTFLSLRCLERSLETTERFDEQSRKIGSGKSRRASYSRRVWDTTCLLLVRRVQSQIGTFARVDWCHWEMIGTSFVVITI